MHNMGGTPNNDGSIASYILNSLSPRNILLFNTIVSCLLDSPKDDEGASWKDWWLYHAASWKAQGWSEEDKIHINDIPQLFTTEPPEPPNARFYQFMLFAPEHNLDKITADGNFKPFQATSLLAKVNASINPFWNNLHTALSKCKLITQNYSLLPVDTWHITFATLETESPNIQLNPEQKNKFATQIEITEGKSVGILLLKIKLQDESVSQSIRSIIETLNLNATQTDYLHISLGYQYKNLSITQLDEVRQTLKYIINSYLNKNTDPLLLEAADIYKFTTMADLQPIPRIYPTTTTFHRP